MNFSCVTSSMISTLVSFNKWNVHGYKVIACHWWITHWENLIFTRRCYGLFVYTYVGFDLLSCFLSCFFFICASAFSNFFWSTIWRNSHTKLTLNAKTSKYYTKNNKNLRRANYPETLESKTNAGLENWLYCCLF